MYLEVFPQILEPRSGHRRIEIEHILLCAGLPFHLFFPDRNGCFYVTILMHNYPKDRKVVTALYLVIHVKEIPSSCSMLKMFVAGLFAGQTFSILFITFPCPCDNQNIRLYPYPSAFI